MMEPTVALGGRMKVSSAKAGELKRALNETGWLGQEVLAAGYFRQGKTPSVAAMITGAALIEMLRPPRSKLLPRQFVLAATKDRLVAFKAGAVGIGEQTDLNYHYEVRINPGEQGSFPRADVILTDLPKGIKSEGGTLVIGTERIPIVRQSSRGDPNTDELVELLAGPALEEPANKVDGGAAEHDLE
jgi:hypothetical protein